MIHLEFDDRGSRRRIEELLAPTHELYMGFIFLDQGECTYVRADLVADPDRAREHLKSLLAKRLVRMRAGQ